MKAGRTVFTTTALFTAMLLAGSVTADSVGEPGRGSGKSNPLNNVYFGEQHMHTADSADAFAMGNRNTQELDFYPGLQERLP